MNDSLSVLHIALCNLADHLEGMTRAVNDVRKCFEDSLPTIEQTAGILKDDIDTELCPLVDILNSLNGGDLIDVLSATFGDENTPAEIAFKVSDDDAWGALRYDILSGYFADAHVSISECYWLDERENLKSNWVLSIMPQLKGDAARDTKLNAIEDLVDLIEDRSGTMEEDAK